MAQLGIDSRRQRLFEPLDSFRHFAKTFRVAVGIAAAFFVTNDGEAFSESGGEID